MWNRLRSGLNSIGFADPADRQAARLLQIVLLGILAATTLLLLMSATLADQMLWLITGAILFLLAIGALVALRIVAALQASNQRLRFELAERLRAEEELRTSENLYRTLARNFPNGAVLMFD